MMIRIITFEFKLNKLTMPSLMYLFPVEIWGTISDWVMVSVTTITAYYLYQTLKSQKEVQQIQNELFKIESLRFRESIKPILKFSASTDKMIPGDEDKKILVFEVSNATESAALEVSRFVTEHAQEQQIFIPRGLDDRRQHITKGDNPLVFFFLIDTKAPASEWVAFALTYKDIAGVKYMQRIICICDSHGIEINPSLPEVIN